MKTTFVVLSLLAPALAFAQAPTAMKDPPKITVAVTVKEEPSKRDPKIILRSVRGSGEADYPDGTALQFGVRLKEDQKFVVTAQGYVTAKHWEIELPALSENVYHGIYVCRVTFDPEHQPPGIVPKIKADKRGTNHAVADQKIGTDEEIAKDRQAVLTWYKERATKLRGLIDPVFAEYQAQLGSKDAAKWNKFSDATRDKLFEFDRELANFRKLRLNVLFSEICDRMGNATLTMKDFALDAYGAAIDRPPAGGVQYEQQLKDQLAQIDKLLADAKLLPEPPK